MRLHLESVFVMATKQICWLSAVWNDQRYRNEQSDRWTEQETICKFESSTRPCVHVCLRDAICSYDALKSELLTMLHYISHNLDQKLWYNWTVHLWKFEGILQINMHVIVVSWFFVEKKTHRVIIFIMRQHVYYLPMTFKDINSSGSTTNKWVCSPGYCNNLVIY